MVVARVRLQGLLEREQLVHLHVVHVALLHGEKRHCDLGDGQRLVLVLLHHLGDPLAALQLPASGRIEVRGELGKRRKVAVLGQRQADAATEFLDDRGLGGASHPGHRDSRVDGGTDACVEKVGHQVDLAVGDGDDVGRYERRHVARLRLDDGQCGKRAGLPLDLAAGRFLHILGVDTRGPFQQARVQIEDVAGIGLAAGRAPQQQRHLAVRPGLLGEVVVHHQRVLSPVAEILAHGAARVRGDVLHGGRIGGRCGHHDGVFQRAELLELADHVGYRRVLLSDRHVYALDAGAALIDDGVNCDRSLAGLPIADDQLPLPAADGDHGVHRLQTGLHRLAYRLAGDYTRRHFLDRGEIAGFHRTLAVDRVPQRIHHAPQQRLANRHFQDTAGGLDHVAFGDVPVLAQEYRAHRVLLQVQGQAESVAGEFQHFAVLRPGQTVDSTDAVGHGHYRAHLHLLGGGIEVFDALPDQITDFVRFQSHSTTCLSISSPAGSAWSPNCSSRPAPNRRSPGRPPERGLRQ